MIAIGELAMVSNHPSTKTVSNAEYVALNRHIPLLKQMWDAGAPIETKQDGVYKFNVNSKITKALTIYTTRYDDSIKYLLRKTFATDQNMRYMPLDLEYAYLTIQLMFCQRDQYSWIKKMQRYAYISMVLKDKLFNIEDRMYHLQRLVRPLAMASPDNLRRQFMPRASDPTIMTFPTIMREMSNRSRPLYFQLAYNSLLILGMYRKTVWDDFTRDEKIEVIKDLAYCIMYTEYIDDMLHVTSIDEMDNPSLTYFYNDAVLSLSVMNQGYNLWLKDYIKRNIASILTRFDAIQFRKNVKRLKHLG